MIRRLLIAVPLLVVPLAAVLLAEEPAEGRKLALLVGVAKYGEGSGLRNLDYTEKDVADLGAVLEKVGYKVTILSRAESFKQDAEHLRPTVKNIRDHLALIAKNRKPADTVLIGLTGHGAHLKTTDKLYYCPLGTDLADEKTLLAIDDVMAMLNAQNCAAGSKVLFLDACRNDPADGGATVPPTELKSVTRPLISDPPGGTVALFSCSKGQISHESLKFKRGFLFHTVIEGMSGKAANPKTGEITWPRLTTYVTEELPEAVHAEKGPKVTQTPEIRGEARQFVLAKYDVRDVGSPMGTRPKIGEVKPGANDHTVDLGNGVKLKLVRVPKGKAYLGGTGGKAGTKQAEVAEFYLAVTELTQAQWKAVMGADNNPSKFKGDDLPVETVSWDDAKKYIEALNKKMAGSGYLYRLPTEVEWEYACRGGPISEEESKFDFYLDKPTNSLSSDDANFDGNYPVGGAAKSKFLAKTTTVGSYKPNKLGLYDMHGNVWEWTDTLEGSDRVFRGGSWYDFGLLCLAAFRYRNAPVTSIISLGFRLAASPSP